jgi:cysteine desulfurase
VLSSIGERDSKVIFTASGSEANNLAILGRAFAKDRFVHGSKIITTEGEHASVNAPFDELMRRVYTVAKIPTRRSPRRNCFQTHLLCV